MSNDEIKYNIKYICTYIYKSKSNAMQNIHFKIRISVKLYSMIYFLNLDKKKF